MTASAPGPRWRTQASNFSWRRRSAAPEETSTVSMPNWRKHSVSNAREDSLTSTRATRAATFLVEGVSAGAVPKAFSMSEGRFQYESLLWLGRDEMERPLKGSRGVQKCHYLRWTGGWKPGQAEKLCG